MDENIIFEIILHAGNARAEAYDGLKAAGDGNYEKAALHLAQAEQEIGIAHKVQTDIIQQEAQGQKAAISLLAVHAQDHLMTAVAEKTLIENMIAMYKRIHELEEKLEAR